MSAGSGGGIHPDRGLGADAAVQRSLDGATVRQVIVRAPKLVNIVV